MPLSLRIIQTYRAVLVLAGSAMSLPAPSLPVHGPTLNCFASSLSSPGAENIADTREVLAVEIWTSLVLSRQKVVLCPSGRWILSPVTKFT